MSTSEKKTNKRLKKQLHTIIENHPRTIQSAVAEEAIDYESIAHFFEDLRQHGCISGMVGSLIYYTDTHAFYDAHYDEIEELRHDYEAEIGQAITTDGDWKNYMAWFVFEQVAYRIYSEVIEGH